MPTGLLLTHQKYQPLCKMPHKITYFKKKSNSKISLNKKFHHFKKHHFAKFWPKTCWLFSKIIFSKLPLGTNRLNCSKIHCNVAWVEMSAKITSSPCESFTACLLAMAPTPTESLSPITAEFAKANPSRSLQRSCHPGIDRLCHKAKLTLYLCEKNGGRLEAARISTHSMNTTGYWKYHYLEATCENTINFMGTPLFH